MKFITLFLVFTIFTMFTSRAQQTTYSRGAEYCSMKKIHSPHLPELSPNNPKHSFDVLNYTLDVDIYDCFISPYPNYFDGSNIITFRVDSALNHINLHAVNSSLVIDSVGLPCQSFTHINNILTINFGQTFNPGQEITLGIYYHHNNVEDAAFYASNGFVFTDCEPEGARKWFPCWDKPSDKATLDLTARVPTNVKLGSNGRLQDSTVVDNALYYHWVSIHPVATYLVVMTGKVDYNLDIVYWHKPSDPNDSIPIRFYFNNGENPQPIENIIEEMATYYSDHFGEHPFEKDGFATLNNEFTWGGMENQTLTSLCPGCWSESLIAHEFAHQWFGDMITCGTWADIFLNEGFATWTEAYWNEDQNGYSAYHGEIVSNANYYMSYNPGWAISEPDWAVNTPPLDVLFDYAVTYMKGSCVMHQLRYVLGDSLFFAGIKAYATDLDQFKYQSAVIEDFKNKMEEVSLQDLDWFFDAWVYSPNHPVYHNTYTITEAGGGNWVVGFNAIQTQTNSGFFSMPVEIRVYFGPGNDTIIRVMNSVNNEHFEWTFDQQPIAVFFDPHNDIVLKQATLTVGDEESRSGNDHLAVFQNEPNPFSGATSIRYDLPVRSHVTIKIMDLSGKEIKSLINSMQESGTHQFTLNEDDLQAGIYYYCIEACDSKVFKKMILIR